MLFLNARSHFPLSKQKYQHVQVVKLSRQNHHLNLKFNLLYVASRLLNTFPSASYATAYRWIWSLVLTYLNLVNISILLIFATLIYAVKTVFELWSLAVNQTTLLVSFVYKFETSATLEHPGWELLLNYCNSMNSGYEIFHW